jgi:hypothetical protein
MSTALLNRRRSGHAVKRNYTTALSYIVLGVLPVLWTALWVLLMLRNHTAGYDFRAWYWVTGWRVLHGLAPYSSVHASAIPNPYPAVGVLLLTPFSILPRASAATVFMGLNMLSVPLALWILGVRDWRVYGPALLWPPVLGGWHLANVSLLIGLGVAAIWRFRDNPFVAGALVAVLISAKLFVWPLGVWLLITKRYTSAVYAIAVGIVINLAAWAVVGFDQFPQFVHQLNLSSGAQQRASYTPFNLVLDLGGSRPAAWLVAITAAVGVGVACIAVGRKGRHQQSFTLAIALSLLVTPIVWFHYLALLLVPLAIARPQISPIWGLPFVMFTFPEVAPTTVELIVALSVSAVLVVYSLTRAATGESAARLADTTRRSTLSSVG